MNAAATPPAGSQASAAATAAGSPDVSVIVVSWNHRELLRAALASLGAQTATDHEVIERRRRRRLHSPSCQRTKA